MNRLMLNVAVCLISGITMVSCNRTKARCEITEVKRADNFTTTYVKIDPSKADLPWTILKDHVYLLTKSDSRTPAAGIAIKGRLAVAIQGVVVSPSNDQNILEFEIISGGLIQIVAPLSRAPNVGELAFVFKGDKDEVTGLEMSTKEGKTITVPFSEEKHR